MLHSQDQRGQPESSWHKLSSVAAPIGSSPPSTARLLGGTARPVTVSVAPDDGALEFSLGEGEGGGQANANGECSMAVGILLG